MLNGTGQLCGSLLPSFVECGPGRFVLNLDAQIPSANSVKVDKMPQALYQQFLKCKARHLASSKLLMEGIADFSSQGCTEATVKDYLARKVAHAKGIVAESGGLDLG